jgi:hypothetical protein
MMSAAMCIYGAYLAVHYALIHEDTATPTIADELPEIGYYLSW